MEGLWRYWHRNGQKLAEGYFQRGTKVGVWRWWDEDGALLEEADFGTL